MKSFKEFAKFDYGTDASVSYMKSMTPGQNAIIKGMIDQRRKKQKKAKNGKVQKTS